MTTTTTLAPAELRAAARDHYREACTEGASISGAELGRRFGMSERWGRDRVSEVAADAGPGTPELADAGPGTPEPSANMAGGDGGTDDLAAGTPTFETGTDPGPGALAGPSGGTPIGKQDVPAASDLLAGGTSVVPAGTDTGPWVREVIRWVTTLTVILVAACAARASYDHQRRFVEMAGETEAAWYLPLSVDGMMLVASLNMLVRRWDNQPAGWLTWCALGLGGMASLAANVAAADPTLIGRVVAGWPPVCLIVSYELLMQQLPTRHTPSGSACRRGQTIDVAA